ncbi:MAG: alpha/beta fold hydrolase, partial [Myxococcaceae bacterium]
GWSDGGNMGLHLAVHHPELVRKLVVFGANTRVTGLTGPSLAWVKTAGPGSLGKAKEAYEKMAPDPRRWPVFAQKLTDMWRDMPDVTAELSRIKAPTLIAIGDRDMISIEHATEMYRAIPGAQLFVVPGATHSVLREKPALSNEVIRAFLAEEKR